MEACTKFSTDLAIPLMTNFPDRFFVLIPCAGTGTRAGTSRPKQYQEIAGLAMVVAPDDLYVGDVMAAHPQSLFSVAHVGGVTRAASVLAGLCELSKQGAIETDWVLVHDAARCLVTQQQINALINTCQDDAVGGLLALPVSDTLKNELDGRVSGTVSRDGKWLAQTPQMFRLGALSVALQQIGLDVTDESSAMEAMGWAPRLVASSAHNFKVTYPEDFALAQDVFRGRSER
jgi:2-C-methyl-D-erythritol 4-phosphate cytidylyltransferase/2-C-methyl-D-erythritol 4-phosphate cytidylyltransferase/2-C-methyl-D-erythritol 2,4-cyclodiphosphate synthase